MSRGYYKLVGRSVIEVDNVTDWALALEASYLDGTHWLGQTQIGPWIVSTVFLGLDFSYGAGCSRRPMLFETMIRTIELFPADYFGRIIESPEFLDFQERCSTYDEAEAMHRKACEDATDWVDRAADLLPEVFRVRMEL